MGVFLYSNGPVKEAAVERAFITRGHKKVNKQSVKGGGILLSSPKILIDNVNCLGGAEINSTADDFILGVGTYFYKGSHREEALKKIFAEWDEVLQENAVYGHWAFVVHKNGTTYIVNDMSGSMRLYYTVQNGKIIVSSSMVATVAALEKTKFDRLMLAAYLASHYGGEISPVESIEDVNPLKYLKIEDGKEPLWIDRPIPETERIETTEEAVKYVRGLFEEQIEQLKAIGGERISIELTAGLDSRLISANLKTAGFNYDFLNYPLFGPDREISKQIADGLGKKLLIQTNIPCTDDLDNHYGEFDFGYDFFKQYANPRWVIEDKIQFSGARGECIDTPDIFSDENPQMMETPSLDVLMDPLTTTDMMTPNKKQEYLEWEKDFYQKRGFPSDRNLTEKEIVEFSQILCGQRSGDYRYNSGVQAHIEFYQIYNEWHFYHFITDIANNAKCQRRLTLALIKAIDPEIGSYPFISRRRTKRNSVNETTELPLKYFSYNGIKKMLPKALVNFLYDRMGRSFDKKRFSEIDFDYYKDVVKVDELKKYPNLYSGILNRIYSIEVLRRILSIA